MESKGDAHPQPKHSKLTKFSCTSMQDSSLRIPINMPEELITEILLRLPVKSLLQYRCVSKSWLSLISSPQFVKTHLSICANNKYYTHNRLIFRESEDPPKYNPPLKYNLKGCSLSSLLYDVATESFDMEYPMKNNNPRYGNVVGSVNGLICFCIEEKKFYIWNPSIRKFKKLTCNTRAGYHIIMYGFGYDDVHDDYKMVAVYRYLGKDRSRHNETRVYSLNSDSWIGVDYFQSGPIFNKPAGLFVNGKFHWANTYGDFRSYNGWDLISIDLADGKCRKVEKPWYGEGDFDFTLCLGALGSDLSLFCNSWRGYADLWVMKEYGVKESWTKIFTINRSGDPVVYPFFPFFFMLNEREILFDFGSSFMIYNQKNDSIRYREVINCEAFQEVNLYVESLLWPFSVEGIELQQ